MDLWNRLALRQLFPKLLNVMPCAKLPFVALLFAVLPYLSASIARAHPGGAGGGTNNLAGGDHSVVGGGYLNSASGPRSTVGGGSANTASGTNAMVGGGTANMASDARATVGGGSFNTASGSHAMVGGGFANTASGASSTVGGGIGNAVGGQAAAVLGGSGNTASGENAVVGGGTNNLASGLAATVAGGAQNAAGGPYSFAAGVRAKANHAGSFVWSGESGINTFSGRPRSFTARAPGGVRFITTASGPLKGARLLPRATAWSVLSDRESKTDFRPIKPREVLSNLAAMPVTSWQYKHDPSRRYIGPTSQDFMAAFGLGNDNKGINTLDADGVTFAAIKGLVEELQERDEAMAGRDRTIEELKAKSEKVDRLESELRALREKLEASLPPRP